MSTNVQYAEKATIMKKLLFTWIIFKFLKIYLWERERDTDLLFHLCIRCLLLMCSLTKDGTLDLGILGWCSNQLSYPTKANNILCICQRRVEWELEYEEESLGGSIWPTPELQFSTTCVLLRWPADGVLGNSRVCIRTSKCSKGHLAILCSNTHLGSHLSFFFF